MYDLGLGYDQTWRPSLSSVTSPLVLGSPLSATGTQFRGYSFAEASGGGTSNSATNYPLAQLRRLDNSQVRWLLPQPAQPFSTTAFTSQPVRDFPPGPSLVTVFVNGIPSAAEVIQVTASTTTSLTTAPNPSVQGQAVTLTTAVTSPVGAPTGIVTFTLDTANITRTLSNGVATYVTHTLSAGAHSSTATYGGNANFVGSSSTTIQNVSVSCVPIAGVAFNFMPVAPRVGQPVTFTPAPTGGTPPITYTWRFGASAEVITALSSIVHTFPVTHTYQTYTVTLAAANACNDRAADPALIRVQPFTVYLPLSLR